MEEKKILVPYTDFVDGIKAKAQVEAIKNLLQDELFTSSSIKAVLGLEKKDDSTSGY